MAMRGFVSQRRTVHRILHSAGADIPEWYDAGKVAIESSSIPLRTCGFLLWCLQRYGCHQPNDRSLQPR